MALSQKHRSTIYQRLQPILGEEEAEALLSHFPARELDEPVTKEFVRAEIAELRTDLRGEIAELRTDLRGELAELRTDLRAQLAELRTEGQAEIAELRTEGQAGDASLRTEIAALRTELHDRLRAQTAWLTGVTFGGLGLAAAIGSAFG